MTNEIEEKIPQAISNAVKYGQLQGELANAQTTKITNEKQVQPTASRLPG